MGLIKKAVAVGTLGASVAAEKGVKAGAGRLSARGRNLTPEEQAAGAIFAGMSHEEGRNSAVTLSGTASSG